MNINDCLNPKTLIDTVALLLKLKNKHRDIFSVELSRGIDFAHHVLALSMQTNGFYVIESYMAKLSSSSDVERNALDELSCVFRKSFDVAINSTKNESILTIFNDKNTIGQNMFKLCYALSSENSLAPFKMWLSTFAAGYKGDYVYGSGTDVCGHSRDLVLMAFIEVREGGKNLVLLRPSFIRIIDDIAEDLGFNVSEYDVLNFNLDY
jgi:hypothetical protein